MEHSLPPAAANANTHTTSNTDPQPSRLGAFVRHHLREYAMLLSLLAIMVFFQVLTDGTLLQPLNLTNLILQNSYIVVMALGMLLVIVAGHIDLSVGSVSGFIGALAALLMVQFNWPALPASIVCLLVGAVIGAAQGWFVAYMRIPSFIVTLAGMLVFKGLALAVLQGQSLGPFTPGFQMLSSGFVPDLASGESTWHLSSWVLALLALAGMVSSGLRGRHQRQQHSMEVEPLPLFLARGAAGSVALLAFTWLLCTYRGLPNVLIIMAVLVLAYGFVAERTTLGRRIYALGGNEKAARLSGVNTEFLSFLTFVNMGALAALAGLIFAARLNTATPKAGLGFELDVIAACFIGGASASGGVGKISGAVIGAFVMGVMNNGMSILGIGIDYQQVIKGLVLLAAVFVDVIQKRR